MSSFEFDKQFKVKVNVPGEEMEDGVELGHMKNAKYERLLKDYLYCNVMYMQQFNEWQDWEKQLKRRDIDTVCAYELYQMKKEFTGSNVLDLS